MSEQDGAQMPVLQRPTTNDRKAWKIYWEAQGQLWRTEPEIDAEHQKYLAERRSIIPDVKQGTYPFRDNKLSRADVEWLLATHEEGRGPVNWNDENQRQRDGLDLRGAILNEENLSGLPLARMLGGIGSRSQVTPTSEPVFTTTDQRNMAAVHMEGANLEDAHLENANLSRSRLIRAKIRRAHLESAELLFAHLEEAYLSHAHLERASLRGSHLEGTILYKAYLAGTDLRRTIFNNETNLEGIFLWDRGNGYASLADISWGSANLTVVDWSQVKLLGDEYRTRQLINEEGNEKSMNTLIKEYHSAIRANRQLAVALRDQGINEDADWFAYRAQVLKRRILWKQIHLPWILQGKEEIFGWKEKVQRVISGGKATIGQVFLRRIPRRQSIIAWLILSLLVSLMLLWYLPTGMLLLGIIKLALQKAPKIKLRKSRATQNPSQKPSKSKVDKEIAEKLLIPAKVWLKNLLFICKQETFAFLAILLLFFCFFTFLWLTFSIWQLFNHFVGLLVFSYLCMFLLGIIYLRLIMGIIISLQAWEFKRKAGQRTTFREMFELAKSEENMSWLSLDLLDAWMTIIYDDLICYGQYIFSLLLDILSGYGYKPARTLFWYLVVVFGFAVAYNTFGHITSFSDALVFSLTSFHGRGFFPSLGDPTHSLFLQDTLVKLAAAEAVIGLLIEISFIATFTQRFFGK